MKKISFLLIFVVFFSLSYLLFQGIYSPKNVSSTKEIFFTIEKGERMKQIAFNLENKGIIKSDNLFLFYAFIKGDFRKIQSGDYVLYSSMNMPEILNKLTAGDTLKQKITIIEGWDLNDINQYFKKQELFNTEDLFQLTGYPLRNNNIIEEELLQIFEFLEDKPENLSLEGYLFPDTYEIDKEDTLKDILDRILSNFNKKLNSDLIKEIKRQEKSIFEIITMASLIEKEVRQDYDKKIVSGILWKRLKAGIPLQVDATINYITGRENTGVLISETKIDSPYNTYKYKGLPLGPICNPGLGSIKAALYPQESEYWYYLSTKEGEIKYSETLEQHNSYKAKYLK